MLIKTHPGIFTHTQTHILPFKKTTNNINQNIYICSYDIRQKEDRVQSYMTVSTTNGWVEQAVPYLRCFIHLQLNHRLDWELNSFFFAKFLENWPHFYVFQRASYTTRFQL